jgi:2-dehydrotetronate isomerase
MQRLGAGQAIILPKALFDRVLARRNEPQDEGVPVIRLSAHLTMLFSEHDLLERIRLAARCGFRGVEVAFPYDRDPALIAEVLDRHSVEMVLINAPPGDFERGERGLAGLPGRDAEFRDSIGRALDVAGQLRCRQLHVMSGIASPATDPQEHLDTLVANIGWAAAQAEKRGVRVLLEPINRRTMPGYILFTLESAQDVMRRVGHSNVALQFDVFHMQIAGGDLERRFEQALPDIAHVQIAGVPDRHEPADNEVNFSYLLGKFDQLGYQGWIGCEYVPARSTLEGLSWAEPYGIRAPLDS